MHKADITPEFVSDLVSAQFPHWAGLPVTPVEFDGWDNTTFHLGEGMSVRLPSAERYAPQVEKEHRWLPVLARQLPLAIPEPLARGVPGSGFPRPWSVYRWLEGDPATVERITNLVEFATDLAGFLTAMHRIDPSGGPRPGTHNFFRGGPLSTYDAETRSAIAALGSEIDTVGAQEVWEAALGATWNGSPVWVHGDVSASNLLVHRGRLSAVIDFGGLAVGDPACEVTVAWTFFSGESREAFRDGLRLDGATWARGRGWALWKALITWVGAAREGGEAEAAGLRFGWRWTARQVIEALFAEHQGGRPQLEKP
ncbi:MAG: aminoglycoside phosphotransferase [Candidatus Nephthysia bennettiae]|uniref:Aminoglycoside phosphotransferase family protein n=1 Tax=Candidatus Nephthysia bennettiae TaxID=3127016 RepID=A0A934NBZ0_9BACT|nr:aminoglycoside phosphotransferase family protein [Candidatus Dormibacteraeota bacterium]MBJ7611430.1 aminoglycoside phosphotransferase family protein [Candidatus Dormibacteraeota bacterium]PZR89138.1 MAG: aminoglycoside phosphotransferase [Candidatus Dormibacteraeota bacterium]